MQDKVLVESTKRITQGFCHDHLAVDLGARVNEEENYVKAHSFGIVVAIMDGKENNKGSTGMDSYGNYVLVDHRNGYKTRYAHLKKGTISVFVGKEVASGEVLGVMGDSGNAYGRHLHFEVYFNGKRINPISYLFQDFFIHSKKITYQVYDMVKKKWLNVIIVGEGVGILSYAGNFGHSISGLYLDQYTYRVHDKVKNKWLPYVIGRSDYAGNLEHPIDGVQIHGLQYRSHLKNGGWLSWISKVDDTSEGYSGIYGKEIDAIEIKF